MASDIEIQLWHCAGGGNVIQRMIAGEPEKKKKNSLDTRR